MLPKGHATGTKQQPTEWGKIFISSTPNRGLISKIYNDQVRRGRGDHAGGRKAGNGGASEAWCGDPLNIYEGEPNEVSKQSDAPLLLPNKASSTGTGLYPVEFSAEGVPQKSPNSPDCCQDSKLLSTH